MKRNLVFLVGLIFMIGSVRAEFGDTLWSYQTGGIVTSSPTVDSSGNVYFGSQDGSFYSVDASGALRWSYATGDWIDSSGALSSDESTIYFGTWNNALIALNTENGELLWSYATDSLVYGSPAMGEDGTIYFGSSDGFLYALNPDGSLLWEFYQGSELDSSPAVDRLGNVYLGTGDGFVLAVDYEGVELWSLELDVVDGRDSAVLSSPALSDDGVLYVGSSNYYIYAIDTFDGSIEWKYETSDKINASPVLGINDTVICAGYDGFLYVLNDAGFLSWRATVGDVFKSAAVVDALGRIYVASYAGQGVNVLSTYSPEGIELWSTVFTDYIDSSPTLISDGTLYVGTDDGRMYSMEGGAAMSSGEWSTFRRDIWGRANLTDYESPVSGREKLVNISLRGNLAEGQNIIPGFVIEGAEGKSALVRAVGPSLAPVVPVEEVDGLIDDPQLFLFQGQEYVDGNDDWGMAPDTNALIDVSVRVGAQELLSESKDSAYLGAFEGGAYTAIAQGVPVVEGNLANEGVTLVELYDADEVDTSTRLVNVSMRGPVGQGAGIMIAGFAIEGSEPKRLLLRAIGKGLERTFGIEGTVSDTAMMLFSGSDVVAKNNAWNDSPELDEILSASGAAGAFDLVSEDGDAAMVVWLEPGAYTLWVYGENGETGEGLAEIYDLSE